MDPFTMLLMGGSALAGIAGAGRANATAQERLAFDKWLANEELKMSQASRTDAAGNTVRYDPALNQWVTDLTPEQRALQKAGEHEQQLSLTDDAARNRIIRQNAFNRAQGARDDYDRTRADFAFGSNPSEGDIQNDIADLLLRGRRGGTGGQNPNNFIRQRGNLPVVSGSGYQSPISDIADALLKARSGALSERGTRQQQRFANLPAMQSLAAMSDAGGGAPVNFPNFNNLFTATGEGQKGVQTALSSGGRNIDSAYAQLGKASGYGFPSIGDIAKMNAMFNKTGKPGDITPIASSTDSIVPIGSSRAADDFSLYDF